MIHGILAPTRGTRAKMRFSRTLRGKEDVRFLTKPSDLMNLNTRTVTVYLPDDNWRFNKATFEELRKYEYLVGMLFQLYKLKPGAINVERVGPPGVETNEA